MVTDCKMTFLTNLDGKTVVIVQTQKFVKTHYVVYFCHRCFAVNFLVFIV